MALVAFPATAAAQDGWTAIEVDPALFPAANPCTLEPLVLEGKLVGRMKTTEDRNGGLHILTFLDATGLEAEGLVSQATYVGSASEFIELTIANATEKTVIQRARMTGSLPNDNFYIQVVTHFTLSPLGVFTATPTNVKFHCS